MIEILPGINYFPKVLSALDQKKLVKFFLQNRDQLYQPVLKSGHKMNLKMMSCGWHWSAKDYKYHSNRVDIDNQPVLEYPNFMNEMLNFLDISKLWDILILNYYSIFSKLGLHRDNSESTNAIKSGYPILSISVGASCIFQIGGLKRTDPVQKLQLNSGDVLLMGQESRLRYHGVSEIIMSYKSPFDSFLNNGRINFTLRKK